MQGFYAVYDTLFEKLVQQEVRFAEKSGKSLPEDLANAPRFGALVHACSKMLLAKAWVCWQPSWICHRQVWVLGEDG